MNEAPFLQRLARGFFFLTHTTLSSATLVYYALQRRGGTMVFTHHADVDEDGLDRQMGPLVDALVERREPLMEVALVPLGTDLWDEIRRRKRAFLSHAAILGSARILARLCKLERADARERVARFLLSLARPRRIFLIDESGSGQTLLRAARGMGIPVCGIQHGDFQPTNPQYALGENSNAVLAADVLWTWSPWFQQRLNDVSPIYSYENTRVSGRLRYSDELPPAPKGGLLRILLVSENNPSFARRVGPFLQRLRREPDIELYVRPHPAESGEAWAADELERSSLIRSLAQAHVVCGSNSSGMLEALSYGRPVLLLDLGSGADSAGYGAAGIFPTCSKPEEFAVLCRRMARTSAASTARQRELVWGGTPERSVETILAFDRGSTATQPEREALPRETESALPRTRK